MPIKDLFTNVLGIFEAVYARFPLPQYTVTLKENVPIRMRDGIHLMADLYLPQTEEKVPIILARTPYGKRSEEHYYRHFGTLFAGQGFGFVIQDVGGKGDSEGVFYPHRNDGADGADTIAWIRSQNWSSQKVGLLGFSYLGMTAWQAAATAPVETIIPWFTGSVPYNLWYDNDVLLLKQMLFWMCRYAVDQKENHISHSVIDEALMKTTDWKSLDKVVVGRKILPFQDFISHSTHDAFWRQFATPIENLQDIPIFLASGWYDQFLQATLDDFKKLRSSPDGSKKKESRLILGPWTHNPNEEIKSLNLTSEARFLNHFHLILDWVQKWLKGIPSLELPPVTYFLMGKNVWKTANEWPPKGVITHRFDLLDLNKNTIVFSPTNYVPSVGGRMIFTETPGLLDQSFLLKREDVILWSSPPLYDDLAVVGPPKLYLFIDCSTPTIDLSIKLIDMAPDGTLKLVTEGYHRLDIVDTYNEFTLKDTAYQFSKFHRMFIAITHSNFPSHEPNMKLLNIPEVKFTIQEPSFFEINHLP